MNFWNLLALGVASTGSSNKLEKRLGKLMENRPVEGHQRHRHRCTHWPARAVLVASGQDRAEGAGKAAPPEQGPWWSLGNSWIGLAPPGKSFLTLF